MQFFLDFVLSSIGIILVSVVLESVSADGVYKRYIKFAFGLVIMITVISSIYALLSVSHDLSVNDFLITKNSNTYDYKETYNLEIKKTFENNLKHEIEKNITNKLNISCIVSATINEEFDDISLIIICNKNNKKSIEKYVNKMYSISDITFEDER